MSAIQIDLDAQIFALEYKLMRGAKASSSDLERLDRVKQISFEKRLRRSGYIKPSES